MKTISLSDEDYKDLIELTKELRTQDHDSQANPRMWTIDTTHERPTIEGYGDTYKVVLDLDCLESIKVKELNKELLNYYNKNSSLEGLDDIHEKFIGSIENFKEWCNDVDMDIFSILNSDSVWTLSDYLETIGRELITCEEYEQHELNATFFKDDAKKHIEINGHNLRKNPHTYAFSAYRMPKMERLFYILNNIGENTK